MVSNIAVTPALNLKAKYIVHVAGPRRVVGCSRSRTPDKAHKRFEVATEYGCESIAIPLISLVMVSQRISLQIAKETISTFGRTS